MRPDEQSRAYEKHTPELCRTDSALRTKRRKEGICGVGSAVNVKSRTGGKLISALGSMKMRV